MSNSTILVSRDTVKSMVQARRARVRRDGGRAWDYAKREYIRRRRWLRRLCFWLPAMTTNEAEDCIWRRINADQCQPPDAYLEYDRSRLYDIERLAIYSDSVYLTSDDLQFLVGDA